MFENETELDLLPRRLLRERAPALIAEACAWAVGLSDQPHQHRRHGRVVASGETLGARAAAELPLGGEEDRPLALGESRPGSFRDALSALTPDGRVYAERLEEQVLDPFVLETCVLAGEHARREQPGAWAELVDDVGESLDDVAAVVRAAEWAVPLQAEAEQLVLAALGDVPLLEVENEGLPLSLVRAAEAAARGAVPPPEPATGPPDLAGARFLAQAALAGTGLTLPVPPHEADTLLQRLLAEGLEPEEIEGLLPELPVDPVTAARVRAGLARGAGQAG
ncbi:hypothetical protein [Motilibacter aurantiacus]|uniref:hypothetical protein n=1 Tax=Motilibacter aurantiacus TaxID=2714955 RepID=UPI001408223E|nr:hypothetical protein [Motilibacter aurantiacus]NHC44960.1 hypothetical protein [Motilibacter aurantiacus]